MHSAAVFGRGHRDAADGLARKNVNA